MAVMDAGANRPYRYAGKINFDIPGVNVPAGFDFVSGGANRGSAPFGDYPITDYVPRTANGLQGFALNNVYGTMPDPKYPNAPRSDIMLHLDPRGRTLDKLRSSGCLSVPADEWPALRDQIVSLQKQGYKLVAHLDASGQVAIRTADSTAASPVSSTKDFIAYTNETRQPTRDLQTTLAKAGFNPGKIDGINGPQTTAAVRAFQQANGLKPDGIVGPQTSAVMAAYGSGQPKGSPLMAALPQTADFGIQRPLPGGSAIKHGDANGKPMGVSFTDQPMGAPVDPRTLSLAAPFKAPFVSEDHPRSNAVPALPTAPVPFPGRPAALNTSVIAPQAPQQAAPPPMPQQRTVAPPPTPQQAPMVTLASGKQIAPGVYNQGDHKVQVSDDGTGRAKIDIVRGPGAIPGLVDPVRELNNVNPDGTYKTVAGHVINSLIPAIAAQAAPAAKQQVAAIGGNLGGTAQDAANGLVGGVGQLPYGTAVESNIGNAFNGITNLFGLNKPASPPPIPSWAPAGPMQFPALQIGKQPYMGIMTPQAIAERNAFNNWLNPPPVPRSRPLSWFAPAQRNVVQVAPAAQRSGQQQQQSQSSSRAQQDLREAGVLNSFGQMIHT